MIMTICRGIALALGVASMLAACGDAPPDPNQSAPVSAKPAPAPRVALLSNEMVAAVSSGKSASALGVHFALGALPTVDKPLPVQIAIVPHRKFSSVRAHFEVREGLTITAGEDYGPSTEVPTEKALAHQLVLVPLKEGLYMVTVSVDTDSDEGSVTRLFSIPVIVSPVQSDQAPAATAVPTNPGQASPATK